MHDDADVGRQAIASSKTTTHLRPGRGRGGSAQICHREVALPVGEGVAALHRSEKKWSHAAGQGGTPRAATGQGQPDGVVGGGAAGWSKRQAPSVKRAAAAAPDFGSEEREKL